MYAVAVGALEDKRRYLGGYGGSYQNPSSNLSGAVSQLEAYVARLRQLRKIADDHAGKFRSDGLRALFATLQRELDDEYFEEISYHLKQLRFRDWRADQRPARPGQQRDRLRAPRPRRQPGDGGRSGSGSARAPPTPSPSRPATRRAPRSWRT